MKADKESVLFKVLTGSRLYGTNGPDSDYDYKAVCLPALADLLLNKKVTNRKEKPEGVSASARMLAGETETEYLPLQVFMNDFMSGQTYAFEVAFAVMQDLAIPERAEDAPMIKALMSEMVEKFLTKSVQKMVGYAVSQSRMYGLKTQRYTSMKKFVDQVRDWLEMTAAAGGDTNIKLHEVPEWLDAVVNLAHVKPCKIFIMRGEQEVPGLDVCGKTFPLSNKWQTVLDSMQVSLDAYGERVKEFDGEGVDWKALSHAHRITYQVLELCETGFLTFPSKHAKYLLDVKSGLVPLDEATDALNETFSFVDEAVANTFLRERTPQLDAEFEQWKLEKLMELYGLNQKPAERVVHSGFIDASFG